MSIVNLNYKNFKVINKDVYINNKGTPGMLLIHANFCGHCVRFMPKYKELAKYLGTSFKCYAIESEDMNDSLSKSLEVQYFPTIKFIDQNGKIMGTFPSEQERSVENLLKYICKVYHHCVKYH